MSNPLFNALGGIRLPQGNGPLNVIEEFKRFRQNMQGKNPNDEINKLLQSGAITQEQLNQAQQMAHQMRGLFGNFK